MLQKAFFILALILTVSFSTSPASWANLSCTQSMDITDPRFGVTAEVGVKVTFSDIGCAVVWRNLQCAMDQMDFDASSLTVDFKTGETIPMEKAFFTVGCGLETPMGYDIAAFKLREDAEAFAVEKQNCTVYTFKNLLDAGLK